MIAPISNSRPSPPPFFEIHIANTYNLSVKIRVRNKGGIVTGDNVDEMPLQGTKPGNSRFLETSQNLAVHFVEVIEQYVNFSVNLIQWFRRS